jgi:hypothetical protein
LGSGIPAIYTATAIGGDVNQAIYKSPHNGCIYTFWKMTGDYYLRNYDKNYACDPDSNVYLGMNNRFLVTAYECDPSDWGFDIPIYDTSGFYIGNLCAGHFNSHVAAIDAAISALENYENGDLSLFAEA